MFLRTKLLIDQSAVPVFMLLCFKMKLSEAKAQVLSTSGVNPLNWLELSFQHVIMIVQKTFLKKSHSFFPVAGLDLHFPSRPMLESGWINFHIAIGISSFWAIAVFTQGINTLHYIVGKNFFLFRHGWILILFEFLFTPPAGISKQLFDCPGLRLHFFSLGQSRSGAVSLQSTVWSLDGFVPRAWYWEEPSSYIVLCAWMLQCLMTSACTQVFRARST